MMLGDKISSKLYKGVGGILRWYSINFKVLCCKFSYYQFVHWNNTGSWASTIFFHGIFKTGYLSWEWKIILIRIQILLVLMYDSMKADTDSCKIVLLVKVILIKMHKKTSVIFNKLWETTLSKLKLKCFSINCDYHKFI